jgi:hypothetical protein
MRSTTRRRRAVGLTVVAAMIGGLLGITAVAGPAGAAPTTVIYDCAIPLQAGTTAPMVVTYGGTAPASARPNAGSVTATATSATVTFDPTFLNGLIAGLVGAGFPAPTSLNLTFNSIGQRITGPATPLNKVTTNITTAGQAPDTVNGNSFTAPLGSYAVTPSGAVDGDAIQWLPGNASDAAFTLNLDTVPLPIGINGCILANGVTGPGTNPPSGAVSPAPAPWGTTNLVNAAPVPQDQNVQVIKDSPKAITLTATDDVNVASYAIATQPTNGTVVVDNAATGAVTYTPNAGYEGADSFTFTATDNEGKVSATEGTVSLTVIGGASTNETINQEILGSRLYLDQLADGVVTMDPVTLDGTTQTRSSAIDGLRVRDGRGDETTGWVLDAKLLGDFTNQRPETAGLPGATIPMANLGMSEVVCTVVDGGPVAQVTSFPGGNFANGDAVTMCSADGPTSGGSFDVSANIGLVVPPYVYSGNYQATMQFTVQ